MKPVAADAARLVQPQERRRRLSSMMLQEQVGATRAINYQLDTFHTVRTAYNTVPRRPPLPLSCREELRPSLRWLRLLRTTRPYDLRQAPRNTIKVRLHALLLQYNDR